MASTYSAVDSCDNDDVFLSFRGVDTRCNFTSHLYDALCRNNIKVFIDYDIKRGDEITPALVKAIEGAKISIIIFSPDYASSRACLRELAKIMKYRKSKGQIVFPIFYQVEPSVDTYQEAFDRHKDNLGRRREETIKKELEEWKSALSEALELAGRDETIKKELKKLKKWKSALSEALKLAGWHIKKDSDEVDFIRIIIKTISETLENSQSNREKLMSTSIIGQTIEDIFEQVMEWLMNNDISRVGIHGLGGVGKTTIATRVNDKLLDSKAFAHVFWVTVSKELSIYKLQNDIAKVIELDLSKEDDERKRAAKLRKKLKTKKFVLILDDVWEAIEIEDVGIPPLVSGQKLLLTSRNRGVCQRMECQSIEVKPLSEQDALDLFMKESKYKLNDSLEWKVIVHSIVRKCAGLPLAIVVVARRMRGVVEIREWRNALRQLENPCEGENQEVEKKVFRTLKFSYDGLPNDEVRQGFLYCSLFPEDYEIKRNDLITYWIGEGIIKELDSIEAELDRGHCMIDELINASLFEHDYFSEDYIKMHDVIRDMALIVTRENSKAKDGLKLQGLSEETERCVNLKAILIMEDSMLERGVPNLPPNCSKLTTLSFNMLDVIRELPPCFFDYMQNLAVLDMRGGVEGLELLPDSFSYLENLRVLLVQCISLKYIPSLAELKILSYLDFCHTMLKEIPKGMEGLINLRVLKMSAVGSWDAFFPGAFLEKLSHLQILEIEKVEVEAEVLICLKKLETLRIVFYNLENLHSYFKSGHWKRLQEYFIFFSPVKIGSMAAMWKEDNEFKKVLRIEKFGDIGGGKGETDMTLPNNIQFLHLGFWNGSMVDVVKNSAFHNLRKLVISRCEGRQPVFMPALVQGVLLNVEELNICDGRGVEEIISGEEELVGEINNYYYPTIHLPKLKDLTLLDLRNLRSIYKGRMVCPSLQVIYIAYCGEIERLPFWTTERNNLNPIQLQLYGMPYKWWDSLHWDDPHAKSFYQFKGYNLQPVCYNKLES